MVEHGFMLSPKWHASLVNHLVSNGMRGVTVDPEKFREVFRSKYGKVRVYEIVGADKESKAWCADPKNRICDVPGSWFCRGQYPPALQEVLNKAKTFVQLEDFNRKEEDSEYQKLYMENVKREGEERESIYKKQRMDQRTIKSDL